LCEYGGGPLPAVIAGSKNEARFGFDRDQERAGSLQASPGSRASCMNRLARQTLMPHLFSSQSSLPWSRPMVAKGRKVVIGGSPRAPFGRDQSDL